MRVRLVNFLDSPYELQLESRHWRNQSNVTKYFRINYIEVGSHEEWLRSLTLPHPKSVAFFIVFQGKFVGVTYFHSIDYNAFVADWGIYIHAEGMRGRGVGTSSLAKCLDYAKNNLSLKKLYLEVLGSNKPALAVYEKAGFKRVNANSDFWRYCIDF